MSTKAEYLRQARRLKHLATYGRAGYRLFRKIRTERERLWRSLTPVEKALVKANRSGHGNSFQG